MKRKSFIIRLENREQFEMLTDEQAGKLLKAMCRYSATGELPDFTDAMLKFAFSMFRGQLDRDAEKYEEVCQKRSENGKKGGAPKGNQNAAKKTTKNNQNNQTVEKTSKTSLPKCECECDPEPVPDPVPVCECDPEPVSACAEPAAHRTHATQQQISLQDILALAATFGYVWDEQEAREFLAYNLDKGRTDGWGYAVQRWELHRSSHAGSRRKRQDASAEREQAEADAYLSLSNRF